MSVIVLMRGCSGTDDGMSMRLGRKKNHSSSTKVQKNKTTPLALDKQFLKLTMTKQDPSHKADHD